MSGNENQRDESLIKEGNLTPISLRAMNKKGNKITLLKDIQGLKDIEECIEKFYDDLYKIIWDSYRTLELLPPNQKELGKHFRSSLEDIKTLDDILGFYSIAELMAKCALLGLYIGEVKVIDYYAKTKGRPKLVPVLPSTKNWDAYDKSGNRYSIKTINEDSSSTGVWHSYPINVNGKEKPDFEYVIIAKLGYDYSIKSIWELSWEQFCNFKSIKNPENKPYIEIDKHCTRFTQIYPNNPKNKIH